jgi:parallel beta-helix repeat protein
MIEGPGTITGFAAGISLNADSNHVKHVHLISNYDFGIDINSQRNTVSNNTIVGSQAGISVSNGGNKIIGNAITQIPPNVGVGVGINIATCGCSVLHNTVNNNLVGLISNTGSDNVAGNDFSSNTQDGIEIWGPGASVLNNHANANGQDGISLLNGVYGVLVQNNTTNSNGRRGIGLDGLGGTSNNNTIKGNRALGNNPDLFWDGNGTGNAWTFNVCDTYIGISPKPCF